MLVARAPSRCDVRDRFSIHPAKLFTSHVSSRRARILFTRKKRRGIGSEIALLWEKPMKRRFTRARARARAEHEKRLIPIGRTCTRVNGRYRDNDRTERIDRVFRARVPDDGIDARNKSSILRSRRSRVNKIPAFSDSEMHARLRACIEFVSDGRRSKLNRARKHADVVLQVFIFLFFLGRGFPKVRR